MRGSRLALLLVVLVLGTAGPARAQQAGPRTAQPWQFQSWRPAVELGTGQEPVIDGVAASKDRIRGALIGGTIGAVVGVAFSAVMCSAADDPGDNGADFCSAGRIFLTGLAGFALGGIIGYVI